MKPKNIYFTTSILFSAIFLTACGGNQSLLGDNLSAVIPAVDKSKNLVLTRVDQKDGISSSNLMNPPSKVLFETTVNCEGDYNLQSVGNQDHPSASGSTIKLSIKLVKGKECLITINKYYINTEEYHPHQESEGSISKKLIISVDKDGFTSPSKEAGIYQNDSKSKTYYLNALNDQDKETLALEMIDHSN